MKSVRIALAVFPARAGGGNRNIGGLSFVVMYEMLSTAPDAARDRKLVYLVATHRDVT